jgi:hypothetical protein
VLRLSRLICLRVRLHASRRDQSAAIRAAVLGLKLADLMATEPYMLFHLTSYGVCDVVLFAVEDEFAPGEIDPLKLDRLLSQAPWHYRRKAFANILCAETFFVNAGYREYADHIVQSGLPLQARYGRWSVQRNQTDFIQNLVPLVQVANRPYYEAVSTLEQVEESSPSILEDVVFSQDNMFTDMKSVRKYFPRCFADQACHEVRIDLFRMGLLIERHYTDHREYPDSLDVLAPALGGSVPVDPFSGEPYRYIVNDDGFLLYSVGWNQVDDGGSHVYSLVEGDLVWRGEEQ